MAGKQLLRRVASRLCRYPGDQKFCLNRSISLHFRDKHSFVFKAEIQDGRQKWRENNFWEKSPIDSADTLRVKNCQNCSISLHFRDKRIFAFYAEIQDGCKKCRKNDFCKKLPEDSTGTPGVKKISLRFQDKLVFEFNAELHHDRQKFLAEK